MKRNHKHPLNKYQEVMTFTLKVLTWLPGFPGSQALKDYLTLSRHLTQVAKTRGVLAMIDYVKSVRLALLHYLSGEYPGKKVYGVKVAKDGLPLVLSPWRCKLESRQVSDNPWVIRALTTILYATRALSVGKNIDTSSITDAGKAPKINEDYITSF